MCVTFVCMHMLDCVRKRSRKDTIKVAREDEAAAAVAAEAVAEAAAAVAAVISRSSAASRGILIC
jgi:hypothetical protein